MMTTISSAQLTGGTNSIWVEVRGSVHVMMTGTWGGATAKLQVSADDGTTAVDVPGSSLTADGTFVVDVGEGAKIRVNVTGGAGAAITTRVGGVL